MSTATVTVINPVLVDGKWIESGTADMSTEQALEEQGKGTVQIVAIDGDPYHRGACCSDH